MLNTRTLLLLCFISAVVPVRAGSLIQKWVADNGRWNTNSSFRSYKIKKMPVAGTGMDSAVGVSLDSDNKYLYVARNYGITRLDPRSGKSSFLALRGKTSGGRIVSMAVSHRHIWCGLDNGYVGRYHFKTGRWFYYPVETGSRINVMIIRNTAVAVSAIPAGKSYFYFYESKNSPAGFREWIKLPAKLKVKPWKIFDINKRFWFACDMGLFSINPSNHRQWFLCGSRDHLGKTIVHSAVSARQGLLLATSKPQFAGIPANVKIASWGTLYYNYIQDRWERHGRYHNPDLQNFIKVNSKNTNLPPGGIWYYDTTADRAHKLPGLNEDMLKMYTLSKSNWLAAGIHGLYKVQLKNKKWKIDPVIKWKNSWIKDIAGLGEFTALLTKNRLVLINSSIWSSTSGDIGKKQIRKTPAGSTLYNSEEAVYMRQLLRFLQQRR